MRRSLLMCAVMFLGCGPAHSPETSAPATETQAITLADVAGSWSGTVVSPASDSTVATFELTATAEPTGWTMTVTSAQSPDRTTVVPVANVSAAGDSIVVESSPFDSVLRPGQQVSTRSVYRLVGGNLDGTILATYPASGETVLLRSQGTRRPS